MFDTENICKNDCLFSGVIVHVLLAAVGATGIEPCVLKQQMVCVRTGLRASHSRRVRGHRGLNRCVGVGGCERSSGSERVC